jgi:hypothetical protein
MSEYPSTPFNLGEAVWVATASAYHQVQVPCPICFGKCLVTLILGNGEHQAVECDFCRHGCEGPTGLASRYVAYSEVKQGTVTGLFERFGERKVEVNGNNHEIGTIFRDAESAEAYRLRLHADAEQQAQRNFESQFKGAKKKPTWTAGYHRKEIQELHRKLEWHEARLGKLREKEKTP